VGEPFPLTPDGRLLPRYGEASLADAVPSVLAALGIEGFVDVLGVPPTTAACVFVVDGLGWELIRGYPDAAPFLAETAEAGRPITAGFPSTTASSLGSLGTGLPPGEHGLVGYTFAVSGFDRPMNALQWELAGHGEPGRLLERLPPEEFQPNPTVMERAAAAGHPLTLMGPRGHEASGLSRAILRGARYVGADSLEELVLAATAALQSAGRPSAYAYHPFLDTIGHIKGVGSDEWLDHLGRVDAACAAIASLLPPGGMLAVTADHGMVNVPPEGKLDVADHPELRAGVRILGGEARVRHVHVREGALADVEAIWRGLLEDRAWFATRERAIDEGWFGPRVREEVRERIGDLVVAARAPVGVFQREVDPLQSSLVGHHGSLTPVEQLVPWIVVRG
jgi:hypothetical protein